MYLGNFTGTANGSSSVEIIESASGTYIYAMSERMGCARYSYSTVLTVASSGADFTTIQGAIMSYCQGGANAGAVKPLVIAIDPASGPYNEMISLSQIDSGTGDIAGDLVLKATGGSKALIQLQEGDVGADSGLPIKQDVANVILKDLVLCASVTGATFTKDLLHMQEVASNSEENWIEFYGCILTAIDDNGDPMITSTFTSS